MRDFTFSGNRPTVSMMGGSADVTVDYASTVSRSNPLQTERADFIRLTSKPDAIFALASAFSELQLLL
jgi:hypothetical protein